MVQDLQILKTSTKMTYSRKSGFIEDVFAHRTNNNYYTNFNITIELSSPLKFLSLAKGLRELILQYPTLALSLHGPPFTLKPASKIVFGDVVQVTDIDSTINEELLLRFNKVAPQLNIDLPLWRLKVFNFKDTQFLTIFCEHSLFDGNSGVFFLKDLVNLVKEVGETETDLSVDGEKEVDSGFNAKTITDSIYNQTDSIADSSSTSVDEFVLFDLSQDGHIFDENSPLASTEIIDLYNVPILKILKYFWVEKLCPKWLLRYWRSYFDFSLPNLIKNPIFTFKLTEKFFKCDYKIIHFNKIETETLLKNIKKQAVSFTPVISALSCQVFQEIISPAVNSRIDFSSTVDVLINGRRFYPGLLEKLKYSFCVSAVQIILGPMKSERELSKSIQYVNNQVLKQIESKESFKKVGMVKYIDPEQLVHSRVGTHSRATVEISNLGNHNFDGLENIWFSQDLGSGCQIGYSIISSKNGMNIVLGVVPEIFELRNDKGEQLIELYAKEMKTRLILFGE